MLMLSSLDGDAGAYRSLLREVETLLRRYYRGRLHGALASSTDDLVQESLLALHTRRMTYDREQRLTSWLFAIARHKLIDHYRRHRLRATVPLDDEPALLAEDGEEALTARLDVDSLLETVPEQRRELIRRTKLDGASVAEAAASAGMSETAAKVSIHRGLKALMARVAGGQRDER